MGFIIKRSFAITVLNYAGVILGYINLLWLYPAAFEVAELGIFRWVQDTALLIVPFTQLGAGQGLLKFYPAEGSKREQSQIIGGLTAWSLVGYLILASFYAFFNEYLAENLANYNPDLVNFLPIVVFLIAILSFQALLENLARVNLRFRFVAFSKDILVRILSGLLVALYLLRYITFPQVIGGLMGVYGVVFIVILIYLSAKISIDFRSFFRGFNLNQIPRQVYIYSLTTFLGAAGSTLIIRSDSFMVTLLGSSAMNGIYMTAFYMAVVIEIPKRTVAYVAIPLISQSFQKEDLTTINSIYQKSALNLLLLSGLLYLGIICNLDNLFHFMPKGDVFRAGLPVVVIIGLGKLLDMSAGLNSEILVLSSRYKLNLYLTLILAATNIGLNYYLIPIYGMTGAAIASFISLVAFNIGRFIVLKRFYHLQPFSLNTFKAVVILVMVGLLGWLLPELRHTAIDIAYRSAFMVLSFGLGLVILKPSEDINTMIGQALVKLGFKN